MSIDTTSAGSFRLPRMAHARVKDAMRPGVISCAAAAPLREVARELATKHIHCMVVTKDDGTFGVISGLDLLRAVGRDPEDVTAGDIALTEAVTVSAEDSLEQAAETMLEHRVSHVVVVGASDGHPAGVLSVLDIAGLIAWAEA